MFVLDANTGDVRWSRWGDDSRDSLWDDYVLTDHVLVWAGAGYDLDSGDEVWRRTQRPRCGYAGEIVTSPDAVLVPMDCPADRGTGYTIVGIDDHDGTQRWRFTDPKPLGGDQLRFLTIAPDGRTALLQSVAESYRGTASTLLDSKTGKVLYQTTSGDRSVIAPDPHTPVLLRKDSGERGQLVIRNLRTGVEHPLANTCPRFRHLSGGYWPPPDALPYDAQVVVTEASVVVLCDEAEGDATIDVYSRADGTRTASLTETETRVRIEHGLNGETTLLAAPGAIVLANHDPATESSMVAGLS
jgi:hypothetical protein